MERAETKKMGCEGNMMECRKLCRKCRKRERMIVMMIMLMLNDKGEARKI